MSGANPFDNLVAADEAAEADNVLAMLADCDEYHGAMPRDESAALITKYGNDGSWLIRESRNKYVLTVNWTGVVRHLLMDITNDGCMMAGMQFPGLVAMLQHFVEHAIPPQDGVDAEPLQLGDAISRDEETREAVLAEKQVGAAAARQASRPPRVGGGGIRRDSRQGSVWGLPS